MSNEADRAILARLDEEVPDSLLVFDGYVEDSDEVEKTISAPLPYIVFFTSPGYPINPRLASRRNRAQEFLLNAVGQTREQASWAGQHAEDALDGVRLDIAGVGQKVTRTDDNPFVRRDDTWTRPDGGPLFVDSRRYRVRAR